MAILFLMGFSLPWSIAMSDAMWALAALGGLQRMRSKEFMDIWKRFRFFWFAWFVFIAWFLISGLWAIDPAMAKLRIARKWSLLLLPFVVLLLLREERFREALWHGIGWGLGTHLILCFFQWTQIVPVERTIFWGQVSLPAPSQPYDPTGLLDHITFGFIYGLWAAMLLRRWILDHRKVWALALYGISFFFTFMAQGRTGYVVFLVLSAIVLWKERVSILFSARWRLVLLGGAVAGGIVLAMQLGGQQTARWASVAHVLRDLGSGNMSGFFHDIGARTKLWEIAWTIWKEHPWLGVGAGGYEKAKEQILAGSGGTIPAALRHDHPHMLYLWHLSTGGVIGLLTLLAFLGATLRTGWRHWGRGGEWLALAGVAVALHATANDTLEQHFPLFFFLYTVSIGISSIFCSMQSNQNTMDI